MLINIIKLLIVSYLAIINCHLVDAFDEKQFGYYAFDKSGRNELPPRVRPPPYIQSNLQCPGVINVRHLDDGKDTLCGDLKRGILPQNPMNILIHGQHYPFELIKNKTLHFLARSLPYLKEDHENIPKVFKISQTGNELYSNLDTLNQPMINRVKRQAKATVTKVDKSELNDTLSANNLTSLSSKNYRTVNDEESKQQIGCDKKDGILCHIVQALTSRQNSKSSESSGGLINTINNYYQAYKAAQTFSNFVSNLDKSDNEKTSNDPYSTYMTMISSFLNPANNQQAATTTPPSSTSNNALNAFLEYFNGGNSNNAGLSLLGRKKKNPVEMDEYMNGLAAASSMQSPTVAKTEEQVQMAQPTPTACPSIEEYISPVYAKNHLGIWKYIVQVPHEGYFTQTIQKTSCVKNKCDYMDGMCKEANRWVSLLVAEVYYPNSKKPLSNMLPQQSQLKPTIYNSLNTMQNLNNKLNGQSSVFSNADTNAINYELFNSLLPQQNFNEYNHYSNDQFARRASKNHQPISPAVPVTPKSTTSASKFGFPSTSYSLPQFQEVNNQYQNYQPNHNTLANQIVNNQNNPIKSNQAYNTNQHSKTFEQLIDIYNQQLLKQQQQQQQSQFQQLTKQINNAGAYNLIDSLTAASMMYPATVVSQSTGQTNLNQPMIQPIQAQNLQQLNGKQNEQMIKPRSFETMNNHNIMESTLMKEGYLGNNEEVAAASTDDKTIPNEQNSGNQPANVNNANLNNQPQSNQNDQNDNSSRENTINNNNNNEECDGYDNNGCYIIRVYYDWFLVSGSCKCWRPNTKSGSSFETLKKLIVGK